MTQEPGLRGLMIDLVENFDPTSMAHPTTDTRDSIATEDDALLAILHLARHVETMHDRGVVDGDFSYLLSALLMVVRDYVLPLPQQRFQDADPEVDRTPAFLQDAIDLVRRARGQEPQGGG